MIVKWLTELKNDFESPEYALHLIGNCDAKANKLIKSIQKKKDGISDKESEASLSGVPKWISESNITIKIIPFDIDILESKVRDSLHRYIFSKGAIIDFEGLALISKGVGMTMMLLSTQGDFISKEQFDRKLYNWLKVTLGSYLKGNESKASHMLYVYNQDDGEMKAKRYAIKIEDFFVYKKKLDQLNKESLSKINFIKEYQFESKPDSANDVLEAFENDNILSKLSLAITGKKEEEYLEPSNEDKKMFMELVEEVHGIVLQESDFNLGDLKEVVIDNYISKETEMIGTSVQKQKYEAIHDMFGKLLDIKLLESLFSGFNNIYCLPLVIKNTSTASDKNIKIKFYIPKEVSIFKSSEYESDGLVESMPDRFVEIGGLFDQVFDIKSDSIMSVESANSLSDFRFIKESMPSINMFGSRESKYTVHDVYRLIDEYFVSEVHTDKKEYNVVEFFISELFPEEVKMIKPILAYSGIDKDIDFAYRIISNNSNGQIEGKIQVSNTQR